MDFGLQQLLGNARTPGHGVLRPRPVPRIPSSESGSWDEVRRYLGSGGLEPATRLLDFVQGARAVDPTLVGGRYFAPAYGQPLPNPGLLMLQRLAEMQRRGW